MELLEQPHFALYRGPPYLLASVIWVTYRCQNLGLQFFARKSKTVATRKGARDRLWRVPSRFVQASDIQTSSLVF